jgi:polyhydroxybutyrate depolymerase
MSHGDHVHELDVAGVRRRYVVHLPPSFDAFAQHPVVVMMDGRGGTPWTAMKSSGWSRKADEKHFVAVYPEAMKLNPKGPQHFLDNPQMWNAGGRGSNSYRTDVDDAGFLRAVIRDVQDRFNTDPARVYMTGFSNGALMAFRFAVEHADLIAAIGPVAAHFRIRDARPARAVPMIAFFGKQDPISPFEGGEVKLPWGATETRPPARETPERWARAIGLAQGPQVEDRSDGVTITRYGNDVVFYAIDGLGHVWPGGHRLLPERLVGAASEKVNATDIMWSFFDQRALT